ncbi:Pheromone-processing carboxypeptidase KEX1 [Yarrowia sp. E02]|nr:Pheromone-processing carboxypeptidase KEX1 [Yarrowia sp. E02]
MKVSWSLLCGLASFALSQFDETPPSQSDYFVRSIPGLDNVDNYTMHSGNILTDAAHNGNLFFWLVEAQYKITERPKTIVWFNGGPGCSSMDGALLEVGPFRIVDEQLRVDPNKGSWHKYANVLFVDQPYGTGYSYSDTDSYLTGLGQVGDEMNSFMTQFLKLFPERSHDDFYLAGESYAGQYIPYIATKLQETKIVNLKGLLIGNGWMDPATQYYQYVPYALDNGVIEKSEEHVKDLKELTDTCERAMNVAKEKNNGKLPVHIRACEDIMNGIVELSRNERSAPDSEGICVNYYDVSKEDVWPSCGMNWPEILPFVTDWLRQDDTVHALNVNNDKQESWQECNGAVGSSMRQGNDDAAVYLLPHLLENMEILFFNGDRDLICNHYGNERMIEQLEWNGKKGWTEGLELDDWFLDGVPKGKKQSDRNLTYVRIYNASHMVPYDEPEACLTMLNDFIGVSKALRDLPGGNPGKGSQAPSDDSAKPGDEKSGDENSNDADDGDAEHDKKIASDAMWKAYYQAGFTALIVVLIILGLAGFLFWRKNRGHIYQEETSLLGSCFGGISRWRNSSGGPRSNQPGTFDSRQRLMEPGEYYDLGEIAEEDEDAEELVIRRPEA